MMANSNQAQALLSRGISSAQSREIDRRACESLGMHSLVLMENAGRGIADSLVQRGARCVAIACGRGNNGGDGFVIARHLALQGVTVRVLWFAPESRLSIDAGVNCRLLVPCEIPHWDASHCNDALLQADWLADADWLVDSLLGTGATGAIRPELRRVLELMRRHSAHRLAVDIPTGLDADTGAWDMNGCPANVTCTMVAPKRGMLTASGPDVCGEVEVIGIGTPTRLLVDVLNDSPD